MSGLPHGAIQLTGYLLWRGGLLLAGITGFFWLVRMAVGIWLLPQAVTTGLALLATGFGLVLVSLVLERREDERSAG